MASQHTSKKRKIAPVDDESDSDCIILASQDVPHSSKRQRTSQHAPRNVLESLDPAQTQNKRQRTLKCVLIPKYETADVFMSTTPSSRLFGSSPRQRASYHSSAKAPLRSPGYSDPVAEAEVSHSREIEPVEDDTSDSFVTARSASPAPQVHTLDHPGKGRTGSSNGRPRRAVAQRLSYVDWPQEDDLSDDELTGPPTKSLRRKPSRVQDFSSDESDFANNIASSSDDADAFSDHDASEDESSVAPSEDESASDVEYIRNPKKGSKARVERRNLSSKHAAKPQVIAKPRVKADPDKMKRLIKRDGTGLSDALPPLSAINDIFADITNKAVQLGVEKATKHVGQRPIRVATMCSGTESPLLALQMFQEALAHTSVRGVTIEHLFSVEIDPVKQAYIERNFNPPVIFRDIRELTEAVKEDPPMATTAYGGKVPIPKDVDLVIAGTSCIDFSNLNNHKKGLDDDGESGQTWYGMLAFCTAFRPAIVILENVLNADWGKMLEDYEDAGYESAGVLVDSKDYYIPQTRQRGYMVCFDRTKMKQHGQSGLAAQWQSLMEKFKRRASSPVSAFLLPNDRVASRMQIRGDDEVREVDWSACEITQMQYRQEKKLGNGRPFTHWQESGTMIVPENGDANWWRNQVERVKDSYDCAVLRNALENKGMFDSRYKTRLWNTSQNIYRDEDTMAFGVCPCITPSARFFISDAGRAMTPEEQLMLQGLPLDKISFTSESPSNIQDLAGNAMTTTVVGSAIISALICGYKLIPQQDSAAAFEAISPPSTKLMSEPCETVQLTEECEVDIGAFVGAARDSLRRCFCEGTRSVAEKPIQQCIDCGHTTCVTCGGNPPHNYRQSPLLFPKRQHPLTFETQLRSQLPLKLAFDGTLDLPHKISDFGVDQKLYSRYRKAVKLAAASTFAFSDIRRTHCWTALYEAADARLELVVDDNFAEWRLYAKAGSDLAQRDPLRQTLEQPVAKSPLAESFANQQWLWRTPSSKSAEIKISSSGSQIPSWWARNQMPEFRDHTVPELLHVYAVKADTEILEATITGTYKHLPRCGKACDSLWIREDDNPTESSMYLFLDPTRLGAPEKDGFVFTHNKAMLEYDEVRPVLARIDPAWKPWLSGANVRKSKVTVDGTWTRASPRFRILPVLPDLQLRKPKRVAMPADCNTGGLLIEGIVTSDQISQGVKSPRENNYVFEAMRRQLQDPNWHALRDMQLDSLCNDCVPVKPDLKWKLETRSGTVRPYEDPIGAAEYERAVKSRLNPLIVQTEVQDTGVTAFRLGLNLKTLAHRAAARLPSLATRRYAEWRLDTNSARPQAVLPAFQLQATKDVQPYSKGLNMSVTLFPIQQLALAWMRQQEAGDGRPFMLEECEEATNDELGWRVEVRVKAPIHIRGGICADHPGFGKTITSLALIQSQLLEQSATAIVDDITNHQPEAAQGPIPIAATLIVCPGVLVKQWVAEIEEKLGCDDVLIINSVADLSRRTIQDFRDAKIVVANRTIFGSEGYAERIATFVGIPGPATKSGSSYEAWLEYAVCQIPAHLRILQDSGIQGLKRHVKQEYKDIIDSDSFDAFVPSRRTRGVEKASASAKSSTSLTARPAAADLSTDTLGTPFFDMFYFNRLIMDEIQQYEPKELTALKTLKADKRWALSGTPALNDTYDVAQMAALLGVILPVGSGARGRMKIKNIKKMEKDRTDFERFDAMRQMPSDEAHARIHENAQSFLDAFVRRNILDFANIEYKEHLVPVRLDLDHRARYTELSQHLNSLDMRIQKIGNKKRSTAKTDRRARFLRAVEGIETAEEALSRDAAFFDRESIETGDHEADGLDAWIETRKHEVEKTLVDLGQAISDAQKAKPKDLADWKAIRLNNKTLGDDETIELVRDTLSGKVHASEHQKAVLAGSKSKPRAKELDIDEDDQEGDEKGKNFAVTKVNNIANQLLMSKRSLRYLENVRRIKSAARKPGRLLKCDAAGCDGSQFNIPTTVQHIAVSALCGHKLCKTCFSELKDHYRTQCPASGCASTVDDYHLLWNNKMGQLHNPTLTPFGAKWAAAIDLLTQIKKENEQAILFMQYPNQLDEASTVLSRSGIPATIVQPSPSAARQIAEFQDTDKKDKDTVIVLNASDETAAGLNLQNANHVLFFSPLLRDSQYGYDSTMKQAIGRVRRYGQEKLIHVYHLVALDTIDVDILEHRMRRTSALKERSAPDIEPPPAVKVLDVKAEPEPERTQLVCEDGRFSLRPRSWLVRCGADEEPGEVAKVKGKNRVLGWEDYSSLIKFSRAYTEDDE